MPLPRVRGNGPPTQLQALRFLPPSLPRESTDPIKWFDLCSGKGDDRGLDLEEPLISPPEYP